MRLLSFVVAYMSNNQTIKKMKIALFLWRLVKFAYYLVQGLGYQVFIDAWRKSGQKKPSNHAT